MTLETAPHPPDSRPWEQLTSIDQAEAWIANTNLELNFFLDQDKNAGTPHGQGVCLTLQLGGQLYIHTTSEGVTLLDLDDDAMWVAPAIMASTGAAQPKGQIWILPEHTLTQLLLGLNELIASTQIVMQHHFKL